MKGNNKITGLFSIYKLYIFGAVVIFFIFFVMYLWLEHSNPNGQYGKLALKISEFIGQLFIVVVIGGFIVQQYNQIQARKNAINEFRKSTLADLIASYSNAKKARRHIRAKMGISPINGEEQILYAIYDQQMGCINDIQLSLEVVKRELTVFSKSFGDPDALIKHVKVMEDYLGKLIDEYEKNLRSYSIETGIPVSKLERLRSFIERGEKTDFGVFAQAFQGALLLLQAERIRVA